MRDNMLIDMSGQGHWTGVDENMEHNINIQVVRVFPTQATLFIKCVHCQNMYSARGVKGPWSNLGDISEGVHIWRPLVKNLRTALGVGWIGSTHTDADTVPVVLKARDKARDESLLAEEASGKQIPLTKDVLALGLSKLSAPHKGTLAAFHNRRHAQASGGDVEIEIDEVEVPAATRDEEFEHDIV
jgi:hypothetical protein